MTRCWLALLESPATDATAQARAYEADGSPAGWLAAWRQHVKPARAARRVDDRLVDVDGGPGWVSLVLPPDGARLPFDDLAVQQARRRVLAEPPQDALSTLMRDASHFEGAITVARGMGVARLNDDPFARIFPARILRIGAGVLGAAAAPAGPVIERYGSANPWPWDRFDTRAP
ncbi:MAG TPA: hypothetical protein VKB28_14295 [Solirubrobacteraceae bacterium]|nr:hypothetical protein [Solirubrobacteraceae bacterium]